MRSETAEAFGRIKKPEFVFADGGENRVHPSIREGNAMHAAIEIDGESFIPKGWQPLAGRLSEAIPPDRRIPSARPR